MNPPLQPSASNTISPCKLASVLILTVGMLLASTVTLKASWLWVLAPVGLLVLWEERMGQGAGNREKREVRSEKFGGSGWLFYAGVFAVAVAFQCFGLPSSGGGRSAVASSGCGSGGCGTAGGCGTGGCGASEGKSCGCGSKASGKTASMPSARPPVPRATALPVPAPRPLTVTLPPASVRTTGAAPAASSAAPALVPPAAPRTTSVPVPVPVKPAASPAQTTVPSLAPSPPPAKDAPK